MFGVQEAGEAFGCGFFASALSNPVAMPGLLLQLLQLVDEQLLLASATTELGVAGQTVDGATPSGGLFSPEQLARERPGDTGFSRNR